MPQTESNPIVCANCGSVLLWNKIWKFPSGSFITAMTRYGKEPCCAIELESESTLVRTATAK